VVLKAVGIDDQLCMDFEYFEMRDGDIYIICSDGLYKDLDDDKVASIIQSNPEDMTVLAETLLKSSLAAGGTDNTSIITLKASQQEDNV